MPGQMNVLISGDNMQSLLSEVETNIIVEEIRAEMRRQDAKWGSQRQLSNERWLAILTEEVGESAKEVLEENPHLLQVELIQSAAVIFQWLKALKSQGRE